MSAKSNPDLQIAEQLAAPFTAVKGRGGATLSYRVLENGGMVVITADGRKLWFTAEEVAEAREELTGEKQESKPKTLSKQQPGLPPRQAATSTHARVYDGMPVLTVLPPKREKRAGDKP